MDKQSTAYLRRSERIAAKNSDSTEQSAPRKRSGSHLEAVLAKRRRNSITSKTVVVSSPSIETSPDKPKSLDDFVNRIYRRAKRRKEAMKELPIANSEETKSEENDLRESNKENQISSKSTHVQVNSLDAEKKISLSDLKH